MGTASVVMIPSIRGTDNACMDAGKRSQIESNEQACVGTDTSTVFDIRLAQVGLILSSIQRGYSTTSATAAIYPYVLHLAAIRF